MFGAEQLTGPSWAEFGELLSNSYKYIDWRNSSAYGLFTPLPMLLPDNFILGLHPPGDLCIRRKDTTTSQLMQAVEQGKRPCFIPCDSIKQPDSLLCIAQPLVPRKESSNPPWVAHGADSMGDSRERSHAKPQHQKAVRKCIPQPQEDSCIYSQYCLGLLLQSGSHKALRYWQIPGLDFWENCYTGLDPLETSWPPLALWRLNGLKPDLGAPSPEFLANKPYAICIPACRATHKIL